MYTNNGLQNLWTRCVVRGGHGILTTSRREKRCTGRSRDTRSRVLETLPQLRPFSRARQRRTVRPMPSVCTGRVPPFALGSYAAYRPGQTVFEGIEGRRVGNLHFCGEHTSVAFQGLMEGACATGALTAGYPA